MKKRLCIILTMLLLTCSIPCNTLAQSKITKSSKKTSTSTFNFKSGVIPSPEDEKSIDSRNVTVKPNKVGITRINDERKKRGLLQLNTTDIAPIGKEAVIANQSAKTVSSHVSANLSASSAAVSTVASSNSVLPSYVDNSKTKYFPPIMNQGCQNSCAACSSTYYVYTNMYALANDIDVKGNDPSDQYKFSPKFTYNFANSGWNDTSHISADMDIICSMGAISLCDYPYDPTTADVTQWPVDNHYIYRDAMNHRGDSHGLISICGDSDTIITSPSSQNLQAVKQYLTDGYVFTFGGEDSSQWEYNEAQDNTSSSNDDSIVGKRVAVYSKGNRYNHAMTLVGYNDDVWVDINGNGQKDSGEMGVFIVANSWGAVDNDNWGLDKGFNYIAYDAVNMISSVSGAPDAYRYNCMCNSRDKVVLNWITAKQNYSPSVVADVNLTGSDRDFQVSFGVTDASSTVPPSTFGLTYSVPCIKTTDYPYAVAYNGKYSSQGSTYGSASFEFDLTDLVKDLTNKRVWISVCDKNKDFKPTFLNDFQIVDIASGNTAHALDTGLFGDGPNQTAVTSIPYWDLRSNYELEVSSRTDQDTLPFYVRYGDSYMYSSSYYISDCTITSPSNTIVHMSTSDKTSDTYINNSFYRLSKGMIPFSLFNYESGTYKISVNMLRKYNAQPYNLTFERSVYCTPHAQSVNTNVALNKSAAASVTNTINDETPSKAVNGTYTLSNDKWCSGAGQGNGSWLSVDLGKNYPIDYWTVIHSSIRESYSPTKNFRLQMSTDNQNWTDIDVVKNNTQSITSRSISCNNCPRYGRYFRLYIDQADNDNTARIYEFQLGTTTPINYFDEH